MHDKKDFDDLFKRIIADDISDDVIAMAKERSSNELRSRFIAHSPQNKPRQEPEPEPTMVRVKVRMIKGAKQQQNIVAWNEDKGMLDVYYLHGYEPEILNMQHERVDDETIIVEMDERAVKLLQNRTSLTELRFISKAAPFLSRPSPLAYNKADIGYQICKHFVPAIEEKFWDDIEKVKETGILPENYEYGNIPFENGMCMHPDRRREAGGAAVVRCDSMNDLTMCSVYEPEVGTPVQIHTESKGVLQGIKLRTYNPRKGVVFTELFDDYGARFDIDTEYNILPTEEDVENNHEPDKQNPILKSKATV